MYCPNDIMDNRLIVNVFALDAILFLILNPTLGKVLPYPLIERYSTRLELPRNYLSVIERMQRSSAIQSNMKEGAPPEVGSHNRIDLNDGSAIITPNPVYPTVPDKPEPDTYGEENFDLSVIPLQKPYKASSEQSSDGLHSRL